MSTLTLDGTAAATNSAVRRSKADTLHVAAGALRSVRLASADGRDGDDCIARDERYGGRRVHGAATLELRTVNGNTFNVAVRPG
jgi:hypothetical protein